MRPLTPGGKPMRALRVLASREYPLSECRIALLADEEKPVTRYYHGALLELMRRGLVARQGPRPYQYSITEAGREGSDEHGA